MSGILAFLRSISARHTALKERIHAFRIPLPPWGQKIMGFVYFTIPVVGGYYIMEYANQQSARNIGINGSKLNTNTISEERKAAIHQSKEALNEIIKAKKP
jgi:hypothetical protein